MTRHGRLLPVFAGALAIGWSSALADNPDWSAYQKSFTIAFSGYAGSTTLTDFPVLIRLSKALNDFDYTKCADGGDLRFSDSGGALLPHEIDTWDSSGESLVWVKVPSLNRATEITAHYGFTGDGQPPAVAATDVWSNGYVGVWHLGQSDVPLAESSGVSTPFSRKYGSGASCGYNGPVGNAIDFSRASGRTGFSAADDDDLDGFESFTVEFWMRKESAATAYLCILQKTGSSFKDNFSYRFGSDGNDVLYTSISSNGTSVLQNSVQHYPALTAGEWTHLAFSYGKPNYRTAVWQNGTNFWQNTGYYKLVGGDTVFSGNGTLSIGAPEAISNASAYKAQYDELRISNVERSADWMKATYDCMAGDGFAAYYAKGDTAWGDYNRKFDVTFPGATNGVVENFPVLVKISAANIEGFSYADCQVANGGDLRFADAHGTLLASEVDTWDPDGVSLVWVKVPSLSSSTKITGYYGCARPHPVASTNVWSEGYVGVWHLNESDVPLAESSGVSTPFSTSHGTGASCGYTGPVGKAIDLSNAKTQTGFSAADDDDLDGFESFTVEFWMRKESAPTSYACMLQKTGSSFANNFSYRFGSTDGDVLYATVSTNGTSSAAFMNGVKHYPTLAAGEWTHLAYSYDKSAYRTATWQDGTRFWQDTGFYKMQGDDTVFSGNGTLTIGAPVVTGANPYKAQYDELRISRVARSEAWMKATYDTVKNNDTFTTYGRAKENKKGTILFFR